MCNVHAIKICQIISHTHTYAGDEVVLHDVCTQRTHPFTVRMHLAAQSHHTLVCMWVLYARAHLMHTPHTVVRYVFHWLEIVPCARVCVAASIEFAGEQKQTRRRNNFFFFLSFFLFHLFVHSSSANSHNFFGWCRSVMEKKKKRKKSFTTSIAAQNATVRGKHRSFVCKKKKKKKKKRKEKVKRMHWKSLYRNRIASLVILWAWRTSYASERARTTNHFIKCKLLSVINT